MYIDLTTRNSFLEMLQMEFRRIGEVQQVQNVLESVRYEVLEAANRIIQRNMIMRDEIRDDLMDLFNQLVQDAKDQFGLNDQGMVPNAAQDGMNDLFDNAFAELGGQVLQHVEGRMGAKLFVNIRHGVEREITVHWMDWRDFTATHIWDTLLNALNSAETVSLRFEVVFSFQRRVNVRGKCEVLQHTFVSQAKSAVQIYPEDDKYKHEGDCLYQMLILGLSTLFQGVQNENRQGWWEAPNLWNQMTRGKNKFEYRREFALRLKSDLMLPQQTDVFEIVRVFENKFNVNVSLLNFMDYFYVIYPAELPISNGYPTIIGLVSSENEKWNHVDLLTKPGAFIGAVREKKNVHRFCYLCCSYYNRKPKHCTFQSCITNEQRGTCPYCHVCIQVCTTCHRKQCTSDGNQLGKCDKCKAIFYNVECAVKHTETCRSLIVRRCELCTRPSHIGAKCNERICLLCKKPYPFDAPESHYCTLSRKKPKKGKDYYFAYDVETCYDPEHDNQHVLYLITVFPLYDYPAGLCDKFRHRFMNNVENPVFIFEGLKGSLDFFDRFICDPLLRGAHLFAHNASRYDSIFVYHEMLQRGYACRPIAKGLRLLHLYYESLDIQFKDSLMFIPSSLRSMASDFGIEEIMKGFFPHKLMTLNFVKQVELNGGVAMYPEREVFDHDVAVGKRGEKELIEREKFLDDFYQNKLVGVSHWNIMDDAVVYCMSDTVLLGQVLVSVRDNTLLLTSGVERPDDLVEHWNLDPLQFITLPSAIMHFYQSQLLPKNTIAIMDRYPLLVQREEELWMLWMTRHNIHHQRMNMDHDISHYQIRAMKDRFDCRVSGIFHFLEPDEVIYVYNDCYNYGCPRCFKEETRNDRHSMSFGECYRRRTAALKLLINCINKMNREHQNVNITWESVWSCRFKEIRSSSDFKKWKKENEVTIERILPMDPRDGYKGGVSEVYKLKYSGDIQMCDFVSQYPTALAGVSDSPYEQGKSLQWPMPVGPFQRRRFPKDVDLNLLGLMKCFVLPPENLYAPFLGFKVPSRICKGSYETIYGLCRYCMSERNTNACPHNDEERMIYGTWTIVEIKYALSIGYTLLSVSDIIEFEGSSVDLFRPFIMPFMVQKILAKNDGLVINEMFTDSGDIIKNWIYKMTGRVISPLEVKDSPAVRTLSKLIMNAFYGKWGQRSVFPETNMLESGNISKITAVLHDSNIDLKFATVDQVNQTSFVFLEYEKLPGASKGDGTKSDVIAAHVTAYGRIMLSQLACKLGNDLIYTDTDSAFHVHMHLTPYKPGFLLGALEQELKLGNSWVSIGRKSYAYEKKVNDQWSSVCKQKGVHVTRGTCSLFNSESLSEYLGLVFTIRDNIRSLAVQHQNQYTLHLERNVDAVLKKMRTGKESQYPTLTVKQIDLRTQRTKDHGMRKITKESEKNVSFLIEALKRIPVRVNDDHINTLPYGYKGGNADLFY